MDYNGQLVRVAVQGVSGLEWMWFLLSRSAVADQYNKSDGCLRRGTSGRYQVKVTAVSATQTGSRRLWLDATGRCDRQRRSRVGRAPRCEIDIGRDSASSRKPSDVPHCIEQSREQRNSTGRLWSG